MDLQDIINVIYMDLEDIEMIWPLDSKNVFVLVLAHLEPELELFEVDDSGDDGDDDL